MWWAPLLPLHPLTLFQDGLVCDCCVNGVAPTPNVLLDGPRPHGLQNLRGLGVDPCLSKLLCLHHGDAPTTLDMEAPEDSHVVWRRDPHFAAKEQDGGHNGLVKYPRNGRGDGVLGDDLGDAAPHTLRPRDVAADGLRVTELG